MNHPIIRARDVLNMSIEEVQQLPDQHVILFDDGTEVLVWSNETTFSHLFWEIFRQYPNARILKGHHVNTHTSAKGEALTTDTHAKLCSEILKTVVADYNLWRPEDKELPLATLYDSISYAMGMLSILTEEDVVSIDYTDFIQIARHPLIQEMKEEAMADPKKIKFVYDKVIKLIESSPEFEENGLAKAVRSKMVKANQVVQCVVFRGFCTEVDGTIFPEPVWSNYTFGNRRFYDFMADSRLAAKSHFYSDTALKDSEYTARRFQLFAMVLERIVYEDCGTTDYQSWLVKGPEYDQSGSETRASDVNFLIGKHYFEEGSTEWKVIQGNEKHLIGKIIHFRSPLFCKAHDPHTVCHVCAGELSNNISRFSNLGHLGSVSITKDFTQNILSIKHVNTSSMVLRVLLGDHEKRYLNTGPEGTAFFLNKELKKLAVKLTVIRDEAPGLIDIAKIDDLSQISLPRISATKQVMLTVDNQEGKSTLSSYDITLSVSQKNKPSMMSRELLKYLKTAGWTLDVRNNFVFDMKGWDFDQPVLVMINKEESYVDLAGQAEVMVRSSQKMLSDRNQKNSPSRLLQSLFDLVNSKLRVNILAFELVVYALMTKSKSSYELARGAKEPVLGIAEYLTKYRDLGPALAYEDMHETLTTPISYFQGRRPDNPMDVFLTPREVIEAEKQKLYRF